MSNWRKFVHLTRQEKKLLLQALLLLPLVHALLALSGYRRLVRFIQEKISVRPSKEPLTQDEKIQRASATALIVSIAAAYGLYRASCLRRSLVLLILLRRQGISAQLCFGARRNTQALEAHAWVEVDGVVVNDRLDISQQFAPLGEEFPATRAGL